MSPFVGDAEGLLEGVAVGEDVGSARDTFAAVEVNVNVELVAVRFVFTSLKLSFIVSIILVAFMG